MLNDKARIRQLAELILISDTDSLDVLDYLLKSVEIIKKHKRKVIPQWKIKKQEW